MKEGFLTVDINSIVKTKNLMDSKYDELVNMLNKYKSIVEESKRIYDTESATLYRKVATTYVTLFEQYLNNTFKPYIDNLDEIKKAYVDELTAISRDIQGGTK